MTTGQTWRRLAILVLGALLLLGAGETTTKKHEPPRPKPQPFTGYQPLPLEVTAHGPGGSTTYANKKFGLSFTLPAGWIREAKDSAGGDRWVGGRLVGVASFFKPGNDPKENEAFPHNRERLPTFHLVVWGRPPGATPPQEQVKCREKHVIDLRWGQVSMGCSDSQNSFGFSATSPLKDFPAQRQELEAIIDSVKFAR